MSSFSEAIDPVTQKSEQLFNPRQQIWHEHFVWSESGIEIVGITACGRSTVVGLRLNNPLAVKVRGHWVRVGWHPPDVAIG